MADHRRYLICWRRHYTSIWIAPSICLSLAGDEYRPVQSTSERHFFRRRQTEAVPICISPCSGASCGGMLAFRRNGRASGSLVHLLIASTSSRRATRMTVSRTSVASQHSSQHSLAAVLSGLWRKGTPAGIRGPLMSVDAVHDGDERASELRVRTQDEETGRTMRSYFRHATHL